MPSYNLTAARTAGKAGWMYRRARLVPSRATHRAHMAIYGARGFLNVVSYWPDAACRIRPGLEKHSTTIQPREIRTMCKRPYSSGWRDHQVSLAFCRPYRSERFSSIAASLYTFERFSKRRAWAARLREDARRFCDGVPRIQYGD